MLRRGGVESRENIYSRRLAYHRLSACRRNRRGGVTAYSMCLGVPDVHFVHYSSVCYLLFLIILLQVYDK